MEVTYTNHEGFYLPNFTLPRKEEASFGRSVCQKTMQTPLFLL